ncbi:MAG: Holliday junction branch migration protein RuvA [Parcubacteria group bacterium]|nr:Holliday junction branch migration protein RuvA [Parcubacteria group bacterium]
MISYLKGTIIAKGSDYIISEAGGVGYKIFLGGALLSRVGVGSVAEFYCYLYLRKDETLELYGVESPANLELFEQLTDISGIGPKAALAITSLGSRERLNEAISKEDASYFKGVHGLGQKKIQKIILELTGKLKTLGKQEEDKEMIDALVALGFPRQRARQAVSQLSSEDASRPLEERVKKALKLMRS